MPNSTASQPRALTVPEGLPLGQQGSSHNTLTWLQASSQPDSCLVPLGYFLSPPPGIPGSVRGPLCCLGTRAMAVPATPPQLGQCVAPAASASPQHGRDPWQYPSLEAGRRHLAPSAAAAQLSSQTRLLFFLSHPLTSGGRGEYGLAPPTRAL